MDLLVIILFVCQSQVLEVLHVLDKHMVTINSLEIKEMGKKWAKTNNVPGIVILEHRYPILYACFVNLIKHMCTLYISIS